jgi:YD repeat-containing protein
MEKVMRHGINLRADGQPYEIEAPGNVITSFGYDIYGRQTSITDKDLYRRYHLSALLSGWPRRTGFKKIIA